ncbi:MAG: homoserine O-succinyltransferase [Clostridiaceae bacterium]|nr:homoserine O-succinyltransferase [Clostridiaceae bacterium]
MPINIPTDLPARETLLKENVFVMTTERAMSQDIRPLRIIMLNLMPTKIVTETQFLRLLGNSMIQVDLDLLTTASYHAKNTPESHLANFYYTFDEIADRRYDGLIITGAPVELLPFEEVTYWDELCKIMDWARANVFSTMFVCWGAQAGLYHHYGIDKHRLPEKMFGVFPHDKNTDEPIHLLRGLDDVFYVPHSRHTTVLLEDIERHPEITLLSSSPRSGVFAMMAQNGREIYLTGHVEYDRNTLKLEYERDLARGLPITIPENYFPNDDPTARPMMRWRSTAHLIFANWLNYYLYQETPYDLNQL